MLLDAAAKGDETAVGSLLDSIPIEVKDAHGSTPLLLASKNNRSSTVKLLLEKNANVNATTRLKATPLIAAASAGHAGVVRQLLAAGADRNMQLDGMTALTLAKRQSKLEVVEVLQESADERKRRAQDAKYGIWSGKLGQKE